MKFKAKENGPTAAAAILFTAFGTACSMVGAQMELNCHLSLGDQQIHIKKEKMKMPTFKRSKRKQEDQEDAQAAPEA